MFFLYRNFLIISTTFDSIQWVDLKLWPFGRRVFVLGLAVFSWAFGFEPAPYLYLSVSVNPCWTRGDNNPWPYEGWLILMLFPYLLPQEPAFLGRPGDFFAQLVVGVPLSCAGHEFHDIFQNQASSNSSQRPWVLFY